MKADDPLLVQAHNDMTERIARYEERIVEVLKGHLSVEHSLNDLLRAARRRWKRSFAGKIDVAQKLFLPDIDESLCDVLRAGNNLRNAVAHGHKEGTIGQRMADLRKALIGWSSPEQRPGIEGMTDKQMVGSAFHGTGSFIVVATMKLEDDKKKG